MSRYNTIIENDVVNGEGVCVSFWTQGCPHKCDGCFNPETWDKNGGQEADLNTIINQILTAISANGIQRNFSILGGEPFADYNRATVSAILSTVKCQFPNIKIFLWTGYTFENLLNNSDTWHILRLVDVLIDGPFQLDKKDLHLKFRGSNNQRVIDVKASLGSGTIVPYN